MLCLILIFHANRKKSKLSFFHAFPTYIFKRIRPRLLALRPKPTFISRAMERRRLPVGPTTRASTDGVTLALRLAQMQRIS